MDKEQALFALAIGESITTLRRRRNLSQAKLASLAGTSRNSIGKAERGEKIPSTWLLQKIAKALEIDLSGLIKMAGR